MKWVRWRNRRRKTSIELMSGGDLCASDKFAIQPVIPCFMHVICTTITIFCEGFGILLLYEFNDRKTVERH